MKIIYKITGAVLIAAMLLCSCGKNSDEKDNDKASPAYAEGDINRNYGDISDLYPEESHSDDPEDVPSPDREGYDHREGSSSSAERYSEENDDVLPQPHFYEEDYSSEEEDSDGTVTGITLTFYKKTLYVDDMVMPIVTMYPEDADDKSEIWTSSDDSVAEVDEIGYIYANGPGHCVITVKSAANPKVLAKVNITVIDDDEDYYDSGDNGRSYGEYYTGAEEPTYISGIIIANKSYPLPMDYAPGFNSEAEEAFERMQEDAWEEGLNIYIASGYRSFEYQTELYERYVQRDGREKADTYSARPGYSEHQTGLAIDLNTIDRSFEDTDEYLWLKKNCYKYGFIIRYPKGAEEITGYTYEPWHIRYLGKDVAAEVYTSGLTLEEYLGIDSKYKDD